MERGQSYSCTQKTIVKMKDMQIFKESKEFLNYPALNLIFNSHKIKIKLHLKSK